MTRCIARRSSLPDAYLSLIGCVVVLQAMPSAFHSNNYIPVLQKLKLVCDDQPSPIFLLVCAQHLPLLASRGMLQHDDVRALSSFLVGKLRQRILAYQENTHAPYRDCCRMAQQELAECRILLAAELDPCIIEFPSILSLKGSEEYTNYRLVCNAVPVADTSHNNAASLRTMFALSTEPQLQHVVDRNLKTAQPCQGQANLPQP